MSLAVDVDWTEEQVCVAQRSISVYEQLMCANMLVAQPCFDGIAHALGKFYAVQPPSGAEMNSTSAGGHRESAIVDAAATAGSLEHRAKHVIYPALRSYLEPSTSLAEAGSVLKIASTASLYRVFERC